METPDAYRRPLPFSLTRSPTGTFHAYGYGQSLQSRAVGMGVFLGYYDWGNSPDNRLFELDSKQLGEPGFSGAAIFSDELRTVVAVQISAATALIGPGRDTVFAMPLYRIALRCPPLTRLVYPEPEPLETEMLDEKILLVIYVHEVHHKGAPMISLGELRKQIGVTRNNVTEMLDTLWTLKQQKGWVDFELMESASAGQVWLTPQGRKVAQDLYKTRS